MNRNRVTVRYAKALLDYAIERKCTEKVTDEIAIIYSALYQINDFNIFISNPAISKERKLESLSIALNNSISIETLNFLKLILEKKREEYIKDICRNFLALILSRNEILIANLKTAIAIDPIIVEKIRVSFEKKTKSSIEIDTFIVPEIIGGFIFTIEGQLYDASMATSINNISRQLQSK